MYLRALLAALLLGALLAGVAAVDVDRDGLDTGRELRAGTNPLLPDTDGDGLGDGTEAERGLDPLARDSDGDGLDDETEVERGLDPLAADTDDDGLSDARERELGTDPTVADTDRDGLADGREVDRGTDPTAADTDADGIPDPEEAAGETDPTLADTDGDGLDDGREREEGTDPLVADTDDDGLVDGAELDAGADPVEPDTDGDGFEDGPEVHRGDVLPGADPTQVDVYVEVDSVGGARLPPGEVQRVVEAYASAPVGPEGSSGIDLHVVFNESDLEERGAVAVTERGPDDDSWVTVDAYADEHFDYEGYGYHYVLVAPDVLDIPDSQVVGEAGDGEFVIEASRREGVTGSTFMHELAHSLGLDKDDFAGIDSHEYPLEEYPSVMNYNAPSDYYDYSAGEPFDDWAAIEADLYVPSRDRLEASANRSSSANGSASPRAVGDR